MSIQPSYPNRPQNNGKVFAGLILLGVGSILLLRQFSFFFFPGWLFSWPMLLIVIGLFNGFKHDFKSPTWFILILIGVVFLSGRLIPGFDLRAYIWPMAIIAVGIWLIVRRNHKPSFGKKWKADQLASQATFIPEADYIVKPEGTTETPKEPFNHNNYSNIPKNDDFLDSLSIFGGVKKIVLSKDFKGGEIVNIFGGSEVDFTRADINGTVMIEITQVFGGVKLIVPPHWQVQSDMAAVFAGIDDKRFGNAAAQTSDKVLILKGISIFAGVDVRSF
ncbi:LiaI-LiaF-like domain-containing protein [Mucilaginibacter terrae]|uniref:LiaF transmembrane domain-containing protein n=1 Tax=Mucilaginibacter terrae TaxID=1955052 RepID=UPI00363BCBC4